MFISNTETRKSTMSEDKERKTLREAVGYCDRHKRSFPIEVGCSDCNAGR